MDVKRPRPKFIILRFQNNSGKEFPQAYQEKKPQVAYKGKKKKQNGIRLSVITLEARP